jgi:hypothetical protein
MIDIATEHLIAIGEVPKHIPCRPNGKRIHISAVYRWVQRGVRGVQLESIRLGGTAYTSTEALQRFADAQTRMGVVLTSVPTTANAVRQRQIDDATQQVEIMLRGRHARSVEDNKR